MKNKLFLSIVVFLAAANNSSAQFVVFNDDNIGASLNQYIRISTNTTANSPDFVPIGGMVVATSQVIGGPHSAGNQWYLIDYPNNSGASTQGYIGAGTPLSLPLCNQSYFTVTNPTGSSNIRIDHSLSASNVQLQSTSLVGWTNQKFALVSTNYVDQDNYRWYNIWLTVNCSQTNGWIAGYSLGTSSTLGTVTSSSYSNVLTAPVIGSATSVGNTSADISWSTPNIDYYYKRYEIYLNGNSQGQYNYDGLSNSITKTLSPLTAGTPYQCYMVAFNASGCSSGQSNIINFTTTGGGCPTQAFPSANAATNTLQTSFQANWAATAGASGYKIDVSANSSFSSFVSGYSNLDVGNVLLKSITGLACNTTYYYRVWAYNNCGNTSSSPSGTISTTTATCPCSSQTAPTANPATTVQQTSFQANWSVASGATGYKIDVSTNNSFSSLVSGYNNLDVGNVLSKNITGLNCNTIYYYRVWAYNSCGNTSVSPSSTIMLTTSSCPICVPLQNANGLPQLLYPLAADLSDYGASHGTWGFYAWGDYWLPSSIYRCNGAVKFHNGLDLHYPNMNALGKNVIAAYDGKVKLVYDAGPGFGQGVVIEHTFNNVTFTTTYIHILPDQHFVNNGTHNFTVHQGDIIGTVAPNSNGNHLHFNIRAGSYDQIAQRGALPSIEDNHPCHCHFVSSSGNSHTDPIFPEYFIDPSLGNYIFSGRNGQHFTLSAVKSKLSAATISLKRNGWSDYFLTGFTDENGISNLRFSNPLNIGDSMKVEAANASTIIFAITSDMITNGKIEIPFIQVLNTGKITHAYVKIQETNSVISQPSFQLKVTADNLTQYQVGRANGDSVIYTNFSAQDSLITLSLQDTGRNYIHVNLISNLDTVKYLKFIDYSPVLDSVYQIVLTADTTSANSLLYVDEQFITKLHMGANTLNLYNGIHNLQISKQNFIDSSFSVLNAGVVNITLNPLLVSHPSDSAILSINNNTSRYWERGITVKRTNNNNTSLSVKGYYDSYSWLSLLPISNTYELQNLTATSVNLDLAALIKRNIAIPLDSAYLLLANDGLYSKVLLSSNEYDSENGKMAISQQLNQNLKFALIKKQAPIINNMPILTIVLNDSLTLPLTQPISDPDLVPNDLTFQLPNAHPLGLALSILGGQLSIYSVSGYVGLTSFIIQATHDGLTVSDTIEVNVINRTGIKNETNPADIRVYPNPSNGKFVLEVRSEQNEVLKYRVFSMNGEMIMESPYTTIHGTYTKELNLTNSFSSSIYVIQINIGAQTVNRRITIK